jgi:hypothetical protein
LGWATGYAALAIAGGGCAFLEVGRHEHRPRGLEPRGGHGHQYALGEMPASSAHHMRCFRSTSTRKTSFLACSKVEQVHEFSTALAKRVKVSCAAPGGTGGESDATMRLLDTSTIEWYYCIVNSNHRKSYDAIHADPVRANIPWKDIEALLINVGATVTEGAGSRVTFDLKGVQGKFHRPHPQKETDRGAVKSVRTFLDLAGIDPDAPEGEGDEPAEETP